MRLGYLLEGGLVVALAGTAVAAPKPRAYNAASTEPTDLLAAEALANLKVFATTNSTGSCNIKTAAKRREWYVFLPGASHFRSPN